MKKKINSINKLKLELEKLNQQIDSALNLDRVAYASRLKKIKEDKEKRLQHWIDNY